MSSRPTSPPAPTSPRIPDAPARPTLTPLGKPTGVTWEQHYARYLARERLPALERAVFDLICKGEGVNIRQMAQVTDHNVRRVHEAISYLEEYGYIRCPVDARGRRGGYFPADT